MSDNLMGHNEAEARVKAMMRQRNTGGVEYPSSTNNRGQDGREHHARGEMVGDSDEGDDEYRCGGSTRRHRHKRGENVSSSMPSQGGSHAPSRFHSSDDMPSQGGHHMKPQSGFMKRPRSHYEHHAYGEDVGNGMDANGSMEEEPHNFGQMVGRGFRSAGRQIRRSARDVGHALQPLGGDLHAAAKDATHGMMGGLRAGVKGAGAAIRGAGSALGSASRGAGETFGNALQTGARAMPPTMARRGGSIHRGRRHHAYGEDVGNNQDYD